MLPVFVLLEKNTAHAQKIKRHQYYRYPSMHSAPTDLKRQEKPDMPSLQTDHSKEALACDNHTPPPGRKSPQYRSYENEETVLKSASQELSFSPSLSEKLHYEKTVFPIVRLSTTTSGPVSDRPSASKELDTFPILLNPPDLRYSFGNILINTPVSRTASTFC